MVSEKKRSTTAKMERKVSLAEPVFCSCNALPCAGVCRDIHLQNSRTGICTAAYNDRKRAAVQQRSRKDDDYDKTDVYAVWQHLND
jgi:hypothetical protein